MESQYYNLNFVHSGDSAGIMYAVKDTTAAPDTYLIPWTTTASTGGLTTYKFLEAMDSKGFALASRLSLLGPFPAVEMDSDIVILGKEEWRVRGVFKKDKPEFSRIELDPALVKGD